MFMLGVAYCYFVVFGFVFKFIAGFAPESVNVAPDIEAYFSFVLGMFLAFGITFEVPIIVVLLARFGMASVARLRQARPYVIVGAFILAAAHPLHLMVGRPRAAFPHSRGLRSDAVGASSRCR